MPRLRTLLALVVVALWTVVPAAGQARGPGGDERPFAQDQGLAVITSPLEGAGAGGIVPISGTATHPQFERYELAFAYSPNPTDTWFLISPRGTAPVVNEVLGRWDTSQISDGLYALRLRVFYADGAFLEALVGNVRVLNATPTPSLGNAPPGPSPTPPLPATATQPVIILPPTSTPRATTVAALEPNGGGDSSAPPAGGDGGPRIGGGVIAVAFAAGVRLTLIAFLLLAAYVSLKAALRARPRR